MTANATATHSASFRMFGVHVLVRCRYQACLEGIQAHFHSFLLPETTSSPEIIIECDREEADRYLFRSRPDTERGTPLEGVRVQHPGQPPQPWESLDPPLPPFSEPPFANRFIGLHASCIADAQGNAYLIVGERGNGKSTVSVELVKQYGFSLLTDELTVLYKRSTVVEPLPRPVGVWLQDDQGELCKLNLPAHEVCERIADRPLPLKRILLLRKQQVRLPVPLFTNSAASSTLKILMEQQFNLGCSYQEGVSTLLHLTDQLEARAFLYSDFDQLQAHLPRFADYFLNG